MSTNDIVPFVYVRDGKAFTNSVEIAKAFDKNHKDVLRSIRGLQCSEDFKGRNFAPNKINDLRGESTSRTDMTRDGFMFLVMGFTGEKAGAIKEAYIAAFNRMELALKVEWQKIRDDGKKERNRVTSAFANKGVAAQSDYGRLTNAGYVEIIGKTAAEAKRERNLPNRVSLRDHLPQTTLLAISLSENLTADHLSNSNGYGFDHCRDSMSINARHIKQAILGAKRELIELR